MRFLADAGISPLTVAFLTEISHEAVHVRTLGMQRAQDTEIVARARADSSVILTFDLDFRRRARAWRDGQTERDHLPVG